MCDVIYMDLKRHLTLFHSEGFSQTYKPSDKMEGTGMNKDPLYKQKIASGSEWIILKMGRCF